MRWSCFCASPLLQVAYCLFSVMICRESVPKIDTDISKASAEVLQYFISFIRHYFRILP